MTLPSSGGGASGDLAVQAVNPEGAKLGLVALPEEPTACAVRGKALFIATASGVFSVEIGGADQR
jgi:sugar lactone lactonase YvrE